MILTGIRILPRGFEDSSLRMKIKAQSKARKPKLAGFSTFPL